MSGLEFRAACVGLGYQSVMCTAIELGVSERAVNRYRVVGPTPTVAKLVKARMENGELRARLRRESVK